MRTKIDLLIGIAMTFVLCFLTIGFAAYDQVLVLNGDLGLKKPGVIHITKISEHSSDLPNGAGGPSLTSDGKIKLEYSFTVSKQEANYSATYLIEVQNDSPYDYLFSGFSLEPTVTVTGATSNEAGATLTYEYVDLGLDNQINVNDSILAGDSGVVAVKVSFYVASEKNNTTIMVGGSAGVNTSTDNSGTFYGGVVGSPVTLDLTSDNTMACFNVDVTNTYKSQQTYNFTLTNNNFVLVDSSGNSLNNFIIDAPSETSDNNTQRLELCMMIKDGSQFATDIEKTQVVINPSGLSSFSIGTLTINVDKDEEIIYEGRPEVENVTFEAVKYDQDTSSLITTATWSRKDTDGLSMTNWYINLYSEATDSLITTFTIDGDENIANYQLSIPSSVLTSESFTNVIDSGGNFYIKVYGIDTAGNSGESYCSDTTDYCVASDAISLKYQFTLTYSGSATLTNTESNAAIVYLNNSFDTVITSNTNYTLSGVSITKGTGETPISLESNIDYIYALQEGSSNIADLTILENVINDDITITVNTNYSGWSCLVKGTKIKVYGGYKNVEDIKYDDLLVAYSYELGREVYEYPIKIEEEGSASSYQRTNFSDGSVLNTFSSHGIFSSDANKFVSVLDRSNFDVGTTILKVDNGKFKKVKVVKIEQIEEDTTYYNITSTRYLNVIANDFITTDPILPISNIFEFNENLTWGKDREEYLKTNDFIPYEMLKNYFPKYLYEGIRMGEAKHLINNGIISVEDYVSKFSKMRFVPIPTDSFGKNKWMVTTSLDLANNLKGSYYIEGSYYKLPKAKTYFNKKFIGWYNTADNKYYQNGDLVLVNYGMYFEAVYEDVGLFRNKLFN